MSFCTADDVESRLSELGIAFQTDDGPAESSGYPEVDPVRVADAISYADARIGFAIQVIWNPPSLVGANEYLRHAAVAFACYWLTTRRGSTAPAAIDDEAKRYEAELDKIAKGEMPLLGATYPGAIDDQRAKTFGAPMAANVFYPPGEDARRRAEAQWLRQF